MSVKSKIAAALKKYGNRITVTSGESKAEIRGFIEPLRYKNKMYLNGVMLEPGYFDGGHYLFISADDAVFDNGRKSTVIRMGGDSYVIKRLEHYRAFNETLYIWAILTPYTAPMEDDYDSD